MKGRKEKGEWWGEASPGERCMAFRGHAVVDYIGRPSGVELRVVHVMNGATGQCTCTRPIKDLTTILVCMVQVDYCRLLFVAYTQGYFQGNPEPNFWGCIVLVESSRRRRSPRSMVATTLVAKVSGND
jgi:hypothetical protein